jgi:hypothetical protein
MGRCWGETGERVIMQPAPSLERLGAGFYFSAERVFGLKNTLTEQPADDNSYSIEKWTKPVYVIWNLRPSCLAT